MSYVSEISVSSPQRTESSLLRRFKEVREQSLSICAPLTYDDHLIQSADYVSPPKWHLGHVTWFFEKFILSRYCPGYKVFHPQFGFVFNSYYQTVGAFHARPKRGNLSRPTLEDVVKYRKYVDESILEYLETADWSEEVFDLMEVGLAHEEQHQELLLMDIKHILYSNPLKPAYREDLGPHSSGVHSPVQWVEFSAGMYELGTSSHGFAYDNERPRHKRYVEEFKLANRLVTNGEYLEFMEAGGYEKPEFWLSDGWDWIKAHEWKSPAYWSREERKWWVMTLGGIGSVDEHAPVCHLSYFEADAYARWANKRLPSEFEWEIAARDLPLTGNFFESDHLNPVGLSHGSVGTHQMFGDVWEWTQSAYGSYPGFEPYAGNLGEYNAKFMCNQFSLRGGSCVTSQSHMRLTYRNFFQPEMRWQFSGLRLAK